MQCPDCGDALKPGRVHGIEIDPCPGCRGIWFDVGELQAYRKGQSDPGQREPELPPARFEPAETEPLGDCPRCEAKALIRGHAGEWILFRCSRCSGAFLPHQEPPRDSGWTIDPFVGLDSLEIVGGIGEGVVDFLSGAFDIFSF